MIDAFAKTINKLPRSRINPRFLTSVYQLPQAVIIIMRGGWMEGPFLPAAEFRCCHGQDGEMNDAA
jgi:hypothetical protein